MKNKLKYLNVGMVTYGNLKYTKLTYKYLMQSTTLPINLTLVVGKPGDSETLEWARKQDDIFVISHDSNMGFPGSLNDIYDSFWLLRNDTSPVLVIGNDVMPYPGSVDRLVDRYNKFGEDWISGTQRYTPRSYCDNFPSKRGIFGDNFEATDFDYSLLLRDNVIDNETVADLTEYKQVGDSHNLCLFSKNLFDKIGYVDVNFFPAYFEDNDYARRAQLAGLKMIRLNASHYFHFWSRTVHEADMKKTNDKHFPLNKKYYIKKWGGVPSKETKEGNVFIGSRDKEGSILNYWREI